MTGRGGPASLDDAINDALRTGRPAAIEAVARLAAAAPLAALLETTRALLARATWPEGIHAVAGREEEIFVQRRGALAGRTLAKELAGRRDAQAEALLLSLATSDDTSIHAYAHDVAIGRGDGPTSTRVLEALAEHFTPGDPWLAVAAVARHRLGEPDIGARLSALDDGSEAFATALGLFVRIAHEIVPLTTSLWDLYQRRLAWLGVMLEDELTSRAAPSVLVHALTTAADESCDEAILQGLKERLDDATRDTLAALLPQIKTRKIAKRLAKLVKAASSKAQATRHGKAPGLKEAGPNLLGRVATDGGPTVLAMAKTLSKWKGALPTMPAKGDYHDACEAGGFGVLARAGGQIIVLASHENQVEVVNAGDGTFWLVVAGRVEALWAERASLVFAPLAVSLDLREGSALLLDAAYTPKRAASDEGRRVAIRTARIAYALERCQGANHEVVRIRPDANG